MAFAAASAYLSTKPTGSYYKQSEQHACTAGRSSPSPRASPNTIRRRAKCESPEHGSQNWRFKFPTKQAQAKRDTNSGKESSSSLIHEAHQRNKSALHRQEELSVSKKALGPSHSTPINDQRHKHFSGSYTPKLDHKAKRHRFKHQNSSGVKSLDIDAALFPEGPTSTEAQPFRSATEDSENTPVLFITSPPREKSCTARATDQYRFVTDNQTHTLIGDNRAVEVKRKEFVESHKTTQVNYDEMKEHALIPCESPVDKYIDRSGADTPHDEIELQYIPNVDSPLYVPELVRKISDQSIQKVPQTHTANNSARYPPNPPKNRIRINVAGLTFETTLSVLGSLPRTLLGDPDKRNRFWDDQRQEFFFDRHRSSFSAILHFYQSGGETLVYPSNVPEGIFDQEIKFFELLPNKHIRSFSLRKRMSEARNAGAEKRGSLF